jgi:hypothetical protein
MSHRKSNDHQQHHHSEKHIHLQLDDFQFDFKKKPYPTVLVAGKRDAGKSSTMLSLASKCTHITQWIAFVGNEDCGAMWEHAFGSNATVIIVNNDTLERATAFWKQIKRGQDKKMKKYKFLKQPFPTHEIIGVAVDDVGTFKKASRSDMINEMVSNGRHYYMLMMIGPQQISSMLTPESRNGADYVFILKNTYSNLVYISKLYVGGKPSVRHFVEMAEFVTQQIDENGNKRYMSLVINVDKTGDRLDSIFSIYVHDKNLVPFESIELGSLEWRAEVKKYHDDTDMKEIESEIRKERIQQYKKQHQSQWNQYGISHLDLNHTINHEYDEEEFNEENKDSFQNSMWLEPSNRNESSIEIVIPKVVPKNESQKSAAPNMSSVSNMASIDNSYQTAYLNANANANANGFYSNGFYSNGFYSPSYQNDVQNVQNAYQNNYDQNVYHDQNVYDQNYSNMYSNVNYGHTNANANYGNENYGHANANYGHANANYGHVNVAYDQSIYA